MIFYRYEDKATVDGIRVILKQYELVNETPKGYWITYSWDHRNEFKRWVSKDGKKRFAYPSKEEAMINFTKRKEMQISILSARLRDAKIALAKAKRMYERKEEVQEIDEEDFIGI